MEIIILLYFPHLLSYFLNIYTLLLCYLKSVLKNRVLRRIFGPKREELAGENNEELHNLYASPNITTRVIKSRRMK
jgi:hypothetical protein